MTTDQTNTAAAVQPQRLTLPGALLRAEGLFLLVASLVFYRKLGYSWLALALLVMAPDVSMLAYLLDKRAGAIAYNVVHGYPLPVILGVISLLGGWSVGTQIALIWLAHISLDRAAGFGLKYVGNFKDTHLSRV